MAGTNIKDFKCIEWFVYIKIDLNKILLQINLNKPVNLLMHLILFYKNWDQL
jgi:hypothetical protein